MSVNRYGEVEVTTWARVSGALGWIFILGLAVAGFWIFSRLCMNVVATQTWLAFAQHGLVLVCYTILMFRIGSSAMSPSK